MAMSAIFASSLVSTSAISRDGKYSLAGGSLSLNTGDSDVQLCGVRNAGAPSLLAFSQREGVRGDGLGTEINCWMEARVANNLIDNAGEYNGFLKIDPKARILSNPLKFKNGFLLISENWKLEIDMDKLEKYSICKEDIYK